MQQSDDRCSHEHTAHHQFPRLGTAFRVAVKSGRVRSGAPVITDNASSPALTGAAGVLSRRQKERLGHSLQLPRSSRTNLHIKQTSSDCLLCQAVPTTLAVTTASPHAAEKGEARSSGAPPR
jgi:hypothetical protein